MNAVPFDTLKLAQRLEGAGFSREQAAVTVQTLAESLANDWVTKSDLDRAKADLQGDLRTEFATIRGEVGTVRGEIANVRIEIFAMRSSTANWMITAMLLNTALIIGLGATLYTLIKASVTTH